ncbi:cytochrome c3 family protein [uncultured Gimesia sp.]|uniref:cytochrome c3 family protein n=1 Tax=uncultured Gimesia sp. TaxID=1678688 RepID=UPI0030DD01F4|tara:strand:+ start:8644 stop:9273 length:630 start_codon:yes stop_codon:yes gene_type:complete
MNVSAGKMLFIVGLFSISAFAVQMFASVENSEEIAIHPKADDAPLFPVKINPANQLVEIPTDRKDANGNPVLVSCQSCHGVRNPNPKNGSTGPLVSFHQDLSFVHGKLVCISCHNPEGSYSDFRLASGESIKPEDVMQLCAQCHGPQFRDYQHGSHGGMTGHWDLRKGMRQRNHCVNCHDPHKPAFPLFRPAAGPNDRFPPHHPKGTHE